MVPKFGRENSEEERKSLSLSLSTAKHDFPLIGLVSKLGFSGYN